MVIMIGPNWCLSFIGTSNSNLSNILAITHWFSVANSGAGQFVRRVLNY